MKLLLYIVWTIVALFVLPVSDARGQIAFGEDVSVVIALAEQGDIDAQFKLGHAYFYGKGISRNVPEAVKWTRMAAEQGHGQSEAVMGTFYMLGDGVVPSQTEALKWFRRAAERGDSKGHFGMGLVYVNMTDASNNRITAYAWYALARAQGSKMAARFKDVFEKDMSHEDIIKAQELAIQCLISNYKNCG